MSDGARLQFTGPLGAEIRPIVDAVADAVSSAGIPLDVAVKWGRLTWAVDGDFHHWLCGIGVTKRRVILQWHFGSLLADPDGRLVAASSRFLRTLAFTSVDEVDADVIAGLVRSAVDRRPYFRAHWKEIQAGTLPAGPG